MKAEETQGFIILKDKTEEVLLQETLPIPEVYGI